ncbi:hypothetical protein E3P78_00207 [Wallemia ichthyophaga]|nr:hypothetical protein E3P78_00207 [Wallemia ichthyophaga]
MTVAELVNPDPRYCFPARVSIKHPQLRDLIQTADNSSVYYPHNRSIIKHYLDAPGKPKVKSQLGYSPVTLSTGSGLLASAGSSGEITLQSLDQENRCVLGVKRLRANAAINNHIAFAPESTSSVEPRLLVCNNDNLVRIFRVGIRTEQPELDLVTTLKFNTAVNQASISPNARICVAVGDTNEVHLFDCGNSGTFRRVKTLTSATDGGFSTAWSADGLKFAVSSQDGLCTVWDIRSIKFTSNAASKELMVFTESTNSIHVVDAMTFSPVSQQTLDLPSAASLSTPPFLSPRSEPPLNDEESINSPEFFSTFFPSSNTNSRSLRQIFNNSYGATLNRLSPNHLPGEQRYCSEVQVAGIAFSMDGSRLYAASENGVMDYEINGANTKLFEGGEFISFSTTLVFHSAKKRTKMPPKKNQQPEQKIRLGRPGNNLKMGIVGLPNVGKSSLFNIMTSCDLGKAANFPYATIEPEESKVIVPDERFDWLADHYKPASRVPAFLSVIDIAGLTAGASTGAGLGNAFLSHVRAVDGIFQVVRCFDDADVIHVEGDVDPIRDMEIIQYELRLKDQEWLEKAVDYQKRTARSANHTTLSGKAEHDKLQTIIKALETVAGNEESGVEGMDIRKQIWSAKEVDVINGLNLLTAKPIIRLVNLSKRDYCRKKNKWLGKVKQWVDEKNPGDLIIPFSVALEEELMQLSDQDKEKELKSLEEEYKLPVTQCLGKITTAGYQSLELIRYFTCGEKEVRAWTIASGTKAPQAAGLIHSDFEKNFICGDIMTYDDIKEHKTENAVKGAGKMRQQGKPYVMKDGDIVYWKSNA